MSFNLVANCFPYTMPMDTSYNFMYPSYPFMQNVTLQPFCQQPLWDFSSNQLQNNYLFQPCVTPSSLSFTGAQDTINTQLKTNPALQVALPNQDEETQSKQDKNSSNWWKWALGGLAVVGAGAVFVLTRGKFKGKEVAAKTADGVENLVKKVEFKSAQNIDDAKKFAQENFGVQYHDIDDVGSLNFINEWITRIYNNSTTLNKHSYPRFIVNNTGHNAGLASAFDNTLKIGNVEGHVIGINMSLFKNFDKTLEHIVGNGTVVKKLGNGKYAIANDAYNTEFAIDLVKRMNSCNSATTMKEKVKIITDVKNLANGKIINGKIKEAQFSEYQFLDHELGHIRHQGSTKDFDLMKKVAEYTNQGKEVSNITQEFIATKSIQETASKVSSYATESPAEFVAETFSGMLAGKTYPDDVMALYKKYCGPNVP